MLTKKKKLNFIPSFSKQGYVNGSPQTSKRSKSVSSTVSAGVKYPTVPHNSHNTPPPKMNYMLYPDVPPITKSKSHESQLANKVVDIDPVRLVGN